MNFIDMRMFFNTAYSVSKNSLHLGSDHLGRDVCVNFIKTIFQILHNDVIDNINKFNLLSNCVCKYQMFIQKKPRTSRILSGQVTFFR